VRALSDSLPSYTRAVLGVAAHMEKALVRQQLLQQLRSEGQALAQRNRDSAVRRPRRPHVKGFSYRDARQAYVGSEIADSHTRAYLDQ
jgi:hypothetical protein